MTDMAERYTYAAQGTNADDIFRLTAEALNGPTGNAKIYYKSIDDAATDFSNHGRATTDLNVYRVTIEKVERQ